MPFKSEAQRRYLWIHHPEIAQRWASEYGSKPESEPERPGRNEAFRQGHENDGK